MHGPAERLNAETIAGAKGRQTLAIPEDKGEHAMQPLDDVHTPMSVTFENDFGIGVGAEDRALTCELLAQLEEIINLAVEDDYIASICTQHWLIAGGKINDRQPAMAEKHVAL